MSVCNTYTGPSQSSTNFITSTLTATQFITGDATTLSSSSAVVTTSCTLPLAIGDFTVPLEICTPVTSFVPVQTVIPGAVTTSTSFSTTVFPNVVLLPGAVSTVCTTTTSVAPAPVPVITTTTTTTTTAPRAIVTPTSTTPITTTTVAPTTTTPLVVVAVPTVAPTTTSTPLVITSDGRQLTITSFSTLVITMTGADGQVSFLTTSSGVPSLNSAGSGSGSGKSHTGAIVGGVVGGLLGAALLVLMLLLFRKKGCFRHDDEHFNDDIWAPEAHGQGVVGIGTRSAHPDEGELDDGAHSGEGMSEKEAGESGVYETRAQSWYGGMASDHGHLSQRATSPSAYSSYERADELTQDASAAAAARVRRSVSGHASHDSHHSRSMSNRSAGHGSLQSVPPVALYQSRRMSQHEFYQDQESRARSPTSPSADYDIYGARGGMYDRAMEQRREELERLSRRKSQGEETMTRHESMAARRQSFHSAPVSPSGPPSRHNSRHVPGIASRQSSMTQLSSSDHSTNAATTGSISNISHGANHYGMRPLTTMVTPASPTTNYNKPYDFRRPQLEVITGGLHPRSGHGSSASSSGLVPSLVSSSGSMSGSSDARTITPPALLDPPTASFLNAERPKFERTNSSSSIIPPSQYLGARVVNVDE